MKKYEILYDWINSQIAHISDSDVAEAFAVSLEGQVLGEFVVMTEALRNYGVDVAAAKAGRTLLSKWAEIGEAFDEFGKKFPGFPEFHRNSLQAFCCVAGWLCVNHAPILDAADVDEQAFEMRNIPGVELSPAWFVYQNAGQILDSLVVFDSREVAVFKVALSSQSISPELAFSFLAALAVFDAEAICPSALVKRAAPQIKLEEIEAFVELHLAMAGLPTHIPKRVARTPTVVNKDSIRAESAYRQWSDVLLVLSEYNSRGELLLKYLTIYHVVENLMFKMPIVALERKRSGAMFSIRDFRRLYDSVSVKELSALEKMFAAVFDLDAIGAVKYGRLVKDAWNRLLAAHGSATIDAALERMGFETTSANFSGQKVHANYAKLVYVVRNSIVHNKETEFHLTSQSLNSGISSLIEEFLLPTLEQISFGMIGDPNDKLWYGNRVLMLY